MTQFLHQGELMAGKFKITGKAIIPGKSTMAIKVEATTLERVRINYLEVQTQLEQKYPGVRFLRAKLTHPDGTEEPYTY